MTATLHIPDDLSTLSGDEAVLMYLMWRRRYMNARSARTSTGERNEQLRQEPETGVS